MTMQAKKQMENQSQTKYMQSNEPQIAGGEAERKKYKCGKIKSLKINHKAGK